MTPRIQVERRAREGVILKVIGEDGPVAAGVYFPQGGAFCLLVTGMPEHHLDNPPEASMSALYYFSLEYAFENGLSRSILWAHAPSPMMACFSSNASGGSGIKDEFSIDSMLFKPANNCPRAARFCELFPIVARKGEALELVICTNSEKIEEAEYHRLVANSHCNGLDPVRLVHLNDAAIEQVLAKDGQPPVHVQQASLQNFSEVYTARLCRF